MPLKQCNHSASLLVYQRDGHKCRGGEKKTERERERERERAPFPLGRAGIWKVTPCVRTSKDEELDRFPWKECHLKESSVSGSPGRETLPTQRPHRPWSCFYFCHTTRRPHTMTACESPGASRNTHITINKDMLWMSPCFNSLKISEVGSRISWTPFTIPVEVSGTGPVLCGWSLFFFYWGRVHCTFWSWNWIKTRQDSWILHDFSSRWKSDRKDPQSVFGNMLRALLVQMKMIVGQLQPKGWCKSDVMSQRWCFFLYGTSFIRLPRSPGN